jgi:hypothetical protein
MLLRVHSTPLSSRPLLIDPEAWDLLYRQFKHIEAYLLDHEIKIKSTDFRGLKAYVTPFMTVGQLKKQISDTIGCKPSDLQLADHSTLPYSDDQVFEDLSYRSKYFSIHVSEKEDLGSQLPIDSSD